MGGMAKSLQVSIIHHILLNRGGKCTVTIFVTWELLYASMYMCIYNTHKTCLKQHVYTTYMYVYMNVYVCVLLQ